MTQYFFIISSLLLLHQASSAPSSPPWKNWQFCKPVDPSQNNPCLVKAIEDAVKDIVNGSTYFGVPNLDPLLIPELALFQAGKDSKAVAVNITFSDCKISAFNAWTLSEVRSDWEKGNLYGLIHLTKTVVFKSKYTVNGKIILLPVRGKGDVTITFEKMKAHLHLKGQKIEKKGKKYFTLDSFQVTMEPKSVTFNFENLFDGQKNLGDSINKVLNENWQEVLVDVAKPVSEGLGAAFKQISNRIFNKIPYDVLVPK